MTERPVIKGNKRPTMQSIAANLGISRNSVFLALNDKSGVGEELRRQIMEEARRVGYGGYASQTPDAMSRCIIVVVPEYLHNDAFFYSDVFWAIESEAKKRGCIAINSTVTREAERTLALPALPEGMKVLGFLVIGVMDAAYVRKLYEAQLPMLSVDISYCDPPISCVGTANHSGGYLATRHLIEKGHRRIGFIGPVYAAQSVYERWCGFRQAMEQEGLPIDQGYDIIGRPGPFELFDTMEALSPLFDRLDGYPTAWFCGGDRIALAAINLLSMRGLRVPEDVSIMGFDDIPVAKMVFPQLTTVHVKRKRMGRLATEYLLRATEQHQELMHMCLPCSIVERGSIAAPRAQATECKVSTDARAAVI
ncbi:MAG: LacI family transcriptional regulator [Clostridiales bacterium]|nr:LacI family transcriptional regulator [Clostridiales bacterium]